MEATKACVAIIDDDASVRRALARLLSAYSIDNRTFASGQEFLDALTASKPSCIVLDHHMAEMTGLELQRHLRRYGINIPTIIVTAHDQPHLRELVSAEGAVDCLSKPLREDDLLRAIERAMKLSGGAQS